MLLSTFLNELVDLTPTSTKEEHTRSGVSHGGRRASETREH